MTTATNAIGATFSGDNSSSTTQVTAGTFPLFLVNEQQQQQQFGWQHISEKKPLFLLFSCSLSSSSSFFFFKRSVCIYSWGTFLQPLPSWLWLLVCFQLLQLLATTINVMIFCLPFSFSSRLAATICTHCLSSQCAV